MKFFQKEEYVYFFCAQNINYEQYGMLITNKNIIYHFRGSSHFGPSVRPVPLITETWLYALL